MRERANIELKGLNKSARLTSIEVSLLFQARRGRYEY